MISITEDFSFGLGGSSALSFYKNFSTRSIKENSSIHLGFSLITDSSLI